MHWNDLHDRAIDIADTAWYKQFDHMNATTPEGFRCDPLAHAPIVFMGSCDLNGPIEDSSKVWCRQLYEALTPTHSFPYIAIGKMYSGFHAVVRRLYTYCEKYGPPSRLMMVIPRPVAAELPMNGKLLSVSERERWIKFLVRNNKIDAEEAEAMNIARKFYQSQQDNLEYQLYQFQSNAAFLQMIVERHNIDFYWTPNLSATAVDYYAKWFEPLISATPFLAKTCVGVAHLSNFSEDGSMGSNTQANVTGLFLRGRRNIPIIELANQLKHNLIHLVSREPALYEKISKDART